MQVEQIDREAARVLLLNYPSQIATECAFARHRHQARAEVVGEIVAWLRMNAMSGHTLAAQIEDKFGEAGND